MKTISISKKILSGFLFIIVVGAILAGLASYYIFTLNTTVDYYRGEYSNFLVGAIALTSKIHDVTSLIVPSLEGNGDNREAVRMYPTYKSELQNTVTSIANSLKHNMISGDTGTIKYVDGIRSSIGELFTKCDAYMEKLERALPKSSMHIPEEEDPDYASDDTEANEEEAAADEAVKEVPDEAAGEEPEEAVEEEEEESAADFNMTNAEFLQYLRAFESDSISKCHSMCVGIANYLGNTVKNKNDRFSNMLTTALTAVAIILLIFCAWFYLFISTGIGRPLDHIVGGMSEAEKGHLNTRLNFEGSNEFHSVADSFNSMLEGICQMISKVLGTSDNLATNSQQLSSASVESAATLLDISKNVNDLNNSTLEISNNLEKTSTSIESFSASVQKVAQLAETAVTAVNLTTQAADKGGRTVKKSVDMIGKIKESVDIATQVIVDLNSASLQISEIVNTITAIASQTNLLALNAAIEAARAGEQGKGFTVVAGEVRKLAEESAEAADAISIRIGDILTKTQNAVDSMNLGRGRVDDGIRIIRDVSTSLDNIIDSVNDVNKKITEISSISSEQSSNSQIMARTIEDITSLTKNTSEQLGIVATSVEQQTTTVSQISNSTEDLATLADELHLLVSRFTISN